MMRWLKDLRMGLRHVLFPNVCLCCGEEVLEKHEHICEFCIYKRFADANPDNRPSAANIILPTGVAVQQALWRFDKGGVLQNLMHSLKYERLIDVGAQLGGVMARRAMLHPEIKKYLKENRFLLVPVPLHYLKYRKRGFNQAFHIARGIERELHLPICSVEAVIRQKYTQSQTGFSREKRIQNMQEAFCIRDEDRITGRNIIIVDDVFTTGATTFELAQTLRRAGAKLAMIWTIAQA